MIRPRSNILSALFASLVFLTAGLFSVFARENLSKQDLAFFEKRIRPLLANRCYECHSEEAEKQKGGLLLDSRRGWELGGDNGPALIPGDLDSSLLMEALSHTNPDLEMPPKEKLSPEEIANFTRWIRIGAPDPRDQSPSDAALAAAGGAAEAEDLWALEPVAAQAAPVVEDASWPKNDIDRFILASLEEHELKPVADADPLTLLRRLSFDLIGLPPSPEEIQKFSASPDVSTIVDSLLARPQFGERWARHWLDVVRFAESNGKSRDRLMPHAWRYRDYVIDAFNADLPYRRFVTEQIAGDILPASSTDERERLNIATGVFAMGAKTLVAPEAQFQMDLVDDQIDVIGQGILALTVACARCHDHKFDPIPTADYYALAGIFRSTEPLYGRAGKNTGGPEYKSLHVLGPDSEKRIADANSWSEELAAVAKEKKNAAKEIASMKQKLPDDWKERATQISENPARSPSDKTSEADQVILSYLDLEKTQRDRGEREKTLRKKLETIDLSYAMGLRDREKPSDVKIHIRGETDDLGEEVPRGFLSAVSLDTDFSIKPEDSGRLEFAQWLTHPDHPLTARVAVNRIWQHLFGQGLVPTVDNFGANGERPSHPRLLDHLAHRFVHVHDWSMKAMIREIVLSRSYQLSSELDPAGFAADPGNALLWRMNRKRLEAEPLRDALLAAGGTLETEAPPFGSAVAQIGNGEVGRGINNAPLEAPFPYRSVYLPVLRTKLSEYLKTFDFPEPSNPQGQRDTTNVPSQALYLMNNPFVLEQAKHMAERVTTSSGDTEARIELAINLSSGRAPTPAERTRLSQFVQSDQNNDSDRWVTLCHALIAGAEFRYLN